MQRSNTDAINQSEDVETESMIAHDISCDSRPSSGRHSIASSFWIGRSDEEVAPQSESVSHVPSLRQIYGADYNRGKILNTYNFLTFIHAAMSDAVMPLTPKHHGVFDQYFTPLPENAQINESPFSQLCFDPLPKIISLKVNILLSFFYNY
jgi:hypothetical protein